MDTETKEQIKRMCDIILGRKSMDKELDSLALLVGHHPEILNAERWKDEITS